MSLTLREYPKLLPGATSVVAREGWGKTDAVITAVLKNVAVATRLLGDSREAPHKK